MLSSNIRFNLNYESKVIARMKGKSTLRTIVGAIEDNGLFNGLMKFAGAGGGTLAEAL